MKEESAMIENVKDILRRKKSLQVTDIRKRNQVEMHFP